MLRTARIAKAIEKSIARRRRDFYKLKGYLLFRVAEAEYPEN